MARSITKWKDRFSSAKTDREKREPEWKKCERFYDGKHFHGIDTTYEDQIVINLCKTMCDTIRDSVYFKNPKFIFENIGPQDFDPIAKALTQIFPRILQTIGYKAMTKMVVFDALRYGVGYKYNGYSLKGDKANDYLREDEIFSIWVPHDTIFVEKGAHGLWDANYVFMQIEAGFEDVANHPAYKVPKDFTHSKVMNDVSYRDEEDPKRVHLIHVFDRGEGKHLIFTPEIKAFLYTGDWPLGDCPFFPINSLRLNDNGLYPPGILEAIIPLNEELNKMESMKVTHAKRFNRKYHVAGDKLDKDAIGALQTGYDGAIVETDGDTVITPITDADLTPAVYATAVSMFQFMKTVVRVGDYQMGQMPAGDTTATEAQFVQGGSTSGIEYLRDIISDFCERDAQSLVALMRENYDSTRRFRLENGEIADFSKGVLQGIDFNIKIDCEGSAPPDRIEERNEALALYNMFSQNPFINPIKPINHVLKTFKTVNDEAEWLNSDATLQLIAKAMGGEKPNLEAIKSYLGKDQPNLLIPASRWSR
jgi:hypothetical protein